MNTAKKYFENDEHIVIFRIIKGGKYYAGGTTKLIHDLWLICHSAFWPDETFSEHEVVQFKKLIAEHFTGCTNTEERFKELVERTIMAKDYFVRRPWRYMTRPIDWLNINYWYGLSRTQPWYTRVFIERLSKPKHNEDMLLVAEALLDYSKEQRTDKVRACMQVLCEQKNYELLRFYITAILQLSDSEK